MCEFDNLPESIIRYLLNHCYQRISPAYLQVDRSGHLTGWGGLLEHYGIRALSPGQPVEDQVYFLEGLLPADAQPIEIRMVRTNGSHHFGIHIFRGNTEDWVLLLDERVHCMRNTL